MSTTEPLHLQRFPSNHVDSCHVPDDDDHINSSNPSSNSSSHEYSNAEKGLKKRDIDIIPAEERDWPEDIVTFDSNDDPENPKNWSSTRKAVVTMLFGMTTMCSTFASSVFNAGGHLISLEFGVSSEVVTLGLALYILGWVPGPVIFGPLSEMYGRKYSVLVPMFGFICLSAAVATAKDLQTIFITRFFAGVMGSSPVTTVGGGLADMYNQKERGTAVLFYSLAVFVGPALGPVIGSAVSQSFLGWRWTEYLSVILTATVVSIDLFFLPETFAPAILTGKARRLRLKTGRWALHSRLETNDFTLAFFLEKNLTRPVRMFFFEPVVTALVLYNSFAYGILYLLFPAVPIVYEEHRGNNALVASLPFLGVMVGVFIAAGINIWYGKTVFEPHVERNGGKAEPEQRLPPMMIGSVVFPIGFFLLGWASKPSINWFPSVLGLVFIGMGFFLIFQAGLNYLIDTYTKYSASAVAANTFMRSLFAGALSLVAQPLFNNLGINWACTFLGCISILLAGVPFVFYVYGKKLRSMSKLADIDDLNE